MFLRAVLQLSAFTLLCFLVSQPLTLFAESYSRSSIGGNVVDNQPGHTSSFAYIDNNNLARSFVNPASGTAGAEVQATDYNANTSSYWSDHWSCSPSCQAGGIAPINFHFKLDGTISPGYAALESHAELTLLYQLGRSEFLFDVRQSWADGDGFTEFWAHWSDGFGTNEVVPITTSVDSNGNIQFSVDYHRGGCAFCGVIVDPNLYDSFQIDASMRGYGGPQFIDAFHTFSVDITSLDPNYQFVTESGRVIGPAAPNPVPEPGSLLLMTFGLAAIAGVIRRGVHR